MISPKRTLISFDWAAKKILRDKANFDILEGFLTALLRQEMKVLSLLDSEGNQETPEDKFNRVDLLVETQNSELIVVEIQNNREVHYLERMLYGASKLIVDHLQLGDYYGKVKKIISVSILYFLLGEGESDYVYHGSTEFYGLNDHRKLELKHRHKKALLGGIAGLNGNIFPEYYLIEVQRFQDIIRQDLDEWIYFFKHSEIQADFKSPNIQHLSEKLSLLNMSDQERKVYERFLSNRAIEEDILESARMDGREEGKKDGREEIAQKMLAEGIDISLVAKLTGLSKKTIHKLTSDNS